MDINKIHNLHEIYNSHDFIKARTRDLVCKDCGFAKNLIPPKYLPKKTLEQIGDFNLILEKIIKNKANEQYVLFEALLLKKNVTSEEIDKLIKEKAYNIALKLAKGIITTKEELERIYKDNFDCAILSQIDYYGIQIPKQIICYFIDKERERLRYISQMCRIISNIKGNINDVKEILDYMQDKIRDAKNSPLYLNYTNNNIDKVKEIISYGGFSKILMERTKVQWEEA